VARQLANELRAVPLRSSELHAQVDRGLRAVSMEQRDTQRALERRTAHTASGATPGAGTLATAAKQDHELQSALRVLQLSRAEALGELKVSQERARREERDQMHELMSEVSSCCP
jgi:hypothetical protein